MRTIEEIREDIERATERRSELYRVLSSGHDATAAAELKQINERLERLWDEQRQTRATIRFGEPDQIRRRARAEERLSRAA